MKIQSFLSQFIVFLLIFLLFIVPNFFVLPGNANPAMFTIWKFPLYSLLQCFVAVLLYALCTDIYIPSRFKGKNHFFFEILFPGTLALGLLFAVSLFFKFLAVILKAPDQNISVILPASFLQWIFCILTFASGAFFEEVIFRFYFCQGLQAILNRKFKGLKVHIICELSSIAVFALCHIYLGWLSVLNAAAAHIILRFFYKKTGSIWAGTGAHFIYNIISLILL